MTTLKFSRESLLKPFHASSQFWLLNIIGWIAFNAAQSLRNSLDGSSFIDDFLLCIPTSILGILVGLYIHFYYKKLQWYNVHPLCLIPKAGLIGISFAFINILLNTFDLVVLLPETCSRQNLQNPNTCGIVSDLFLQSLGVMLIWNLLYFLIQAERNTKPNVKFSTTDTARAIIVLLTLNHLGILLSVVAYVDYANTYYLFSTPYLVSAIIGTIITVTFSTYVIFIKPRDQHYGSRILPLLPTLLVMSFTCAVLSIGAENAVTRLYFLQLNDKATIYNYIYYVFFGTTYGNFSDKSQLAGALQGSITSMLLGVLFFLTYCFSNYFNLKTTHTFIKINTKKTLIFWCCNCLFWLLFSLLLYATDLMDLNSFGINISLVSTVAFAGIGVFIGSTLRLQVEYFASLKATVFSLVLKIAGASTFTGLLITGALWFINYAYILIVLDGDEIHKYMNFIAEDNYVFASILSSCILCGLWSFICYMIESQHLQRDAAIKNLQIEMSMKEVQLNALAGKIDPHFVFNALNNIRALIDEDSEKARSAIVVLSDILRSPITNNLQDKISIAEEILLVRNYISLSKIQFEDRLIYTEDIDEHAKTALIPSMMLQILVENAIKHGISQLPDGGALSLHIHKREQQLVCNIINHGHLRLNSETSGFGVGIKVINDRLRLLYNDNASFSLHEINNTVVAELILPFENKT